MKELTVNYAAIQRALNAGRIVECNHPMIPGLWRRITSARVDGGKVLVREQGGLCGWWVPTTARVNTPDASAIGFQQNDGGRAAAGFKGQAGDCVTRAIAIATGAPYIEVYNALNAAAQGERAGRRKASRSSARNGVHRRTYERYLQAAGWTFSACMGIGTGCKIHLRADELPGGTIIARVSKHLVTIIDGVIHDTHDCSRGGTRCVYGYYAKR